MTFLRILCAILFLSSAADAVTIRVACGSTSYANVVGKIKEPFEKATGIKVVTVPSDPMAGTSPPQIFGYLMKGEADITAFGSGWEDTIKLLSENGINLSPKEYSSTIVGLDRLQIITNKGVNVAKLDNEQIQKLFTGQVKNWKDLGGADVETTFVVSKTTQPGTTRMFETRMLKGKKVEMGNALDVKSAKDVMTTVASTKGGYGYVPLNVVNSSVVVPEHEVIGRPIIMVTKGKPTEHVRKFLDFIKNEGTKHGVVK